MSYNIQSTKICFGKAKQSDPATANASGDMVSLNKLNAGLINVNRATENDAAWIGKGTEFPTAQYKVQSDISGSLEKFVSTQFAAWVFAFGLGQCTSGDGPSSSTAYSISPLPQSSLDLPTFSFVEQIGSGALDRMAVGNAINSFALSLKSGPGLASATLRADFVGTGILTEPSGITVPAHTAEDMLQAASASVTLVGKNYVSSKDIVSLDLGWSNSLRAASGFYPGSGTDEGFATRGRMEFGARQASLGYVARYQQASDEISKLYALTEGTAVITLGTVATDKYISITFPRVTISSAVVGDTDGIVSVAVSCLPMYDATNGVIQVAVNSNLAGISV